MGNVSNIFCFKAGGVAQNGIGRLPVGKSYKQANNFLKEVNMIDENTSDGYHTFKELYEFRKLYNAAAFNEWYTNDLFDVHKSKKHSDGELCFGGGWFIVVAELPAGQISNHYELKDWDLFDVEEREIPNQFDGHTPQDVLKRIESYLLFGFKKQQKAIIYLRKHYRSNLTHSRAKFLYPVQKQIVIDRVSENKTDSE